MPERAELLGVLDGPELGDVERARWARARPEHVVDADARTTALHRSGAGVIIAASAAAVGSPMIDRRSGLV